MMIVLHIGWEDQELVRLLNLIARIGARQLRLDPKLPLLYDSGVVYQREQVETFRDVLGVLAAGAEDCDSLASYRAGELLARGWRALSPSDPGYARAKRLQLRSIPAEVFLISRSPRNQPGPAHALVRYRVDGRWYEDDPSERLGMRGDVISASVWPRWQRRGILDAVLHRWKGRVDYRLQPAQRRAA